MRPGNRPPSGVRWREDLGCFEMRCDDCRLAGAARYWPLTREFWDPRMGMTRCIACHRRRMAQGARLRRRHDEALAERIRERNRKYRALNSDWLNWKRREQGRAA